MKPLPTEGYTTLYFSTATILGWKHLQHSNPVQEKWRLVDRAEDYVFSSASLYANGDRRWPVLRHFW